MSRSRMACSIRARSTRTAVRREGADNEPYVGRLRPPRRPSLSEGLQDQTLLSHELTSALIETHWEVTLPTQPPQSLQF